MLKSLACLVLAAGSAHACLAPSTPMTSSLPKPAVSSMPDVNCVNGFSKDYCNGTMYRGDVDISSCPTPPEPNCSTVRIKQATYVVEMFSNSAACGDTADSKCDEIKDGRLKVTSNFTIRLHKDCPYRGCWEGEYGEWQSSDGSVYSGTLMGTIGVGTHRASTTPSICHISPSTRDCEKCYDVSYDPNTGMYRIGYEAQFHGKRSDADTGEELCISLSGDFYIRRGDDGTPAWKSEWIIAGTADGVWITFCN